MAEVGSATSQLRAPENSTQRMKNLYPHTKEQLEARAASGRDLRNSHLSDDYSRSLGYKSAPLGGSFIWRDVMHIVVRTWGISWIERGGFSIRWRRPLYDADEVQIRWTPVRDVEGAPRTDYEVVNAEGTVCVLGWASLPHSKPTAPSLSDFPITSKPAVLPKAEEWDKLVGRSLATEPTDMAHVAPMVRAGKFDADPLSPEGRLLLSYEPLRDVDPAIREAKIALPWQLGGGLGGLDTSGVNYLMQTSGTFQCFNFARLEDMLDMRSRVTSAHERNDSKYLIIEHLLVANDRTPVILKRWDHLIDYARARKEPHTSAARK